MDGPYSGKSDIKMAEHAAAAASFVCLLDLRVTHARRRETGISLSPLDLGVRMLSAISAFCHDELPNTFIPRAWQTIRISRSKVFSNQPEITPDRSLAPSDEINIKNRRYLNSPSDTVDASLADLQIKQGMEYLCDTQKMK